MMQIRLHSTLRGQTGRRVLEIDLPPGARIDDALAAATARLASLKPLLFDDAGSLRESILIMRNGRNIERLAGLETPLEAEHHLDIFPKSGMQRAFAKD